MKKIILTFLLLAGLKAGYAQYYTFTQLNQTYVDNPSGTVVSSPGWDYLDVYDIPFPFQFKYFGVDFDTFYVSGGFGGFIYLGNGYYGNYELFFYDAPIMDPGFGQGAISFSVSGTAPNRIMQIQIENGAFLNDQTFSDYFDVQLWFYETTNVIEIHNGPNSVLNNNSWYQSYNGPTIALLRDTSTFIHLYGPANNANSSTTYVADFVTGAPPENSVYRFTPVPVGISNIEQLPVTVYPNPSSGIITINSTALVEGATLSVHNLSGQKVLSAQIDPGIKHLSIDQPNGVYLVKISTEKGQYIQRLIINR